MATYNRFNDVGVYKDIKDELYLVNPNPNYLFDNANPTVAKDRVHYWTEVVFTKKTGNTSAIYEGQALSSFTAPTRNERSNRVEENAVPFSVSTIKAAVAKRGGYAGMKDAILQAREEALMELKANVEYSLVNGTVVVGNASTTADKMSGIIEMASTLGTTQDLGTDIATGEANFKTGLAACAARGGLVGKKEMLVNGADKNIIATNWTGRASAVQTMANTKVIDADVQVYSSAWGPIAIKTHEFMPSNTMVVYNPDDLNVAFLYNTKDIKLGNSGANEAILAVANACTLQYNRPSLLLHFYV